MYFDAYGPFYVVARNRKIKKAEQHKFWEQVRNKSKQNDYENTELERLFGVYVFGIQWGDILTPWYVGQTLAANGFSRMLKIYFPGSFFTCLGAGLIWRATLLRYSSRLSLFRRPRR